MKKVFYSIVLLSGIIFAVSLTNCKKKEKTDETKTETAVTYATIKGKVNAQLNDTTAIYEKAPVGTRVTATVNVVDLLERPDTTINYGKRQFEGTVNADGEYSISIEASSKYATYNITADDFTYNQVRQDTIVRTIFKVTPTSVTANKNIVRIVDLTYYD